MSYNLYGEVVVDGKLVPFERTERGISEERFQHLMQQIDVKPAYVEKNWLLISLSCEYVKGEYINEAVWHAVIERKP